VLEEAHGICAVAMRSGAACFEILRGASDEVLYALLGCIDCGFLAWRTLRLLDDAQLHVKLLALRKAYRLQSPAWPPLRWFRPTKSSPQAARGFYFYVPVRRINAIR
jgi:hypothetical protein